MPHETKCELEEEAERTMNELMEKIGADMGDCTKLFAFINYKNCKRCGGICPRLSEGKTCDLVKL